MTVDIELDTETRITLKPTTHLTITRPTPPRHHP